MYSRDRPSEDELGLINILWESMSPPGKKVFNVIVEPQTKDLYEADLPVPGKYRIAVPSQIPPQEAAGIALDVFHDSVAIKRLEDFSYEVMDDYGAIISERISNESYSRSSEGEFIRKL